MVLSFQYAAHSVFLEQISGIMPRPEIMPALEYWSAYWAAWVSGAYIRGYFEGAGRNLLLPANESHLRLLLDAFMLERALEEAGRELETNPQHVGIPLQLLLNVLDAPLSLP